MLRWLEGYEYTDPPPVTGTSKNGLPQSRGPNGETVEYDVIPFPVSFAPLVGIIAIKEITSSH